MSLGRCKCAIKAFCASTMGAGLAQALTLTQLSSTKWQVSWRKEGGWWNGVVGGWPHGRGCAGRRVEPGSGCYAKT